MIAYLARLYRASHPRRNLAEYHQARKAGITLWTLGYTVICPHLNTAHFDGVVPDQRFLDGDLEILRRCDLMVMLPLDCPPEPRRNASSLSDAGIPVYLLEDITNESAPAVTGVGGET